APRAARPPPGAAPPPIQLVQRFGEAVVKVRQEEVRARQAALLRTSRSAAIGRSLVLPGWGHHYQGHRGRGYVLMTLTATSVATAVWSELGFRDARKAYDQAPAGADFDRLYTQYRHRSNRADLALGILGGLWAYSAFDAAVLGPNLSRPQLSLQPSPRGGGLAVVCLRSF
ncbi:MAG: hypothetical protein AB1505_34850, partial [Candidatus Latescibacterota bacterium]